MSMLRMSSILMRPKNGSIFVRMMCFFVAHVVSRMRGRMSSSYIFRKSENFIAIDCPRVPL